MGEGDYASGKWAIFMCDKYMGKAKMSVGCLLYRTFRRYTQRPSTPTGVIRSQPEAAIAISVASGQCRGVWLLAAILVPTSSFLLSDDDEYQVYVTFGDQSRTLARVSPATRHPQSTGYSVWVDRRKRTQTVQGFGASLTSSSAYVLFHSPIKHQILSDLFGEGPLGLGVSYIRLPMGASDMQAANPYTYADTPNDFNMNHFSIDKDREFIIPVIKEALAINPNLKIMGSPWSAPAWMKDSNKLFGGTFKSGENYQEALAKYFLKFVQAYAAEGIPIDAVTIQNEPMLQRDDYPTMIMDAGTQKAFIKNHLGPMFRHNNVHTKILIWDFNWDGEWYPEQILSDGAANDYIAGVAWHGYSGRHDTPQKFHDKYPFMGSYMTEISGGTWENTDWAGSLLWQTRLIFIGQMRAWVEAIMLWNLALDEHRGPKVGVGGCTGCRGVLTVPTNSTSYTKNVEYYAMGHFSKFVQSGAVRLESASFNWDDLQTVAFQNPDGTTVIIVQNPNESKTATFSIDIDAKHYHYYNLPPKSVATFVK